MVTFVEMTGQDYAEWKEEAIADYAADKVKAGNDDADGALERSRTEFNSLLPDGPETKGHHLFSVVDERTGQKVGIVWYADPPGRRRDTLWIYDIRINESMRGRGFGTAVLKLVEVRAKELGKKRLGLHVFGHNPRARKLYEELGYVATNISMAKNL